MLRVPDYPVGEERVWGNATHLLYIEFAKIRISRAQKQIYLQFCRGEVSKMWYVKDI